MRIELLTHGRHRSHTGIGRYVHGLVQHIGAQADVDLCQLRYLPLSDRIGYLRQLPVGIEGHFSGSIVHFPQITGCAMMLWRPVHPAVVTVHDLGVLVCPEDQPLFTRFERRLLDVQLAGLRRMDHYVVSSDYTSQGLQQLFGIAADRIHKVQLGVDMKRFRSIENAWEPISQRYGLTPIPGTVDLLYVGSELPRKNLVQLLEAVAFLKASGYSMRLIKVGGSGGERWRAQLLADIQRLGLEKNVVVVGVVPEEDLPRFYNIADLSVCPSLLEGGFSWPVMEAMACGTAAIASTASHVPEHVQKAVLIVEPRDLDSVIEAIKKCLDEPSLREHLAKIGHQAIAPFTWEAGIEQMLSVYQKIWLEFEGVDDV
jgi:glycosyltransferase involved in cell wall biosynthesis